MATASVSPVRAELTEDQIKILKSLITTDMVQVHPEIIQLLFQTPSLGFEEKKYWLELLPFMSDEHVDRLRNILVTERKKMNSLEKKYQESMNFFEQSTKLSRDDIKKMHELRKQHEAESKLQEDHLEHSILDELENL